MRFHLISLPHTHTTQEYAACAFTEKVRKFAIMMMARGHDVFLYGGEQNEAPCTEHVVCISEKERLKHVNGRHFIHASFDPSSYGWKIFNQRSADEIRKRHKPGDFVCIIGGTAQLPLSTLLPEAMIVEFGIGYGGTWAKYRVWESYAWMHTCYGAASNGNPNAVDGIWYDAVIPGYFEPENFPFRADKEDYCLFVGRLIERKGLHIAAEVCERLSKRLIVAGQGDPPKYGEYVGVIGPEERGRLMSGAQCVFVPTTYIEPFGNVAVEAQASGTPVISTDWGAMTETVVHGVTGFRCRTLGEFCSAVERSKTLDPYAIRAHVMGRYSLDVIGNKYENYFLRLSTLFTDGWYSMEPMP